MRKRPWQGTESPQWTRNGLTQTKLSSGSPCRSDHVCVRESSKVMIGQTPLEALKAIISIAANHKETISITSNVSRAYFHAKAQRPVLTRLPVEDRMCTDVGKVGLMKKSMYGTRDAASNWERDWPVHVRNWGFQHGLSSRNLFHHKENRVSGLTHGDDFVLTGLTKEKMELQRKMTSVYPVKAKIIVESLLAALYFRIFEEGDSHVSVVP